MSFGWFENQDIDITYPSKAITFGAEPVSFCVNGLKSDCVQDATLERMRISRLADNKRQQRGISTQVLPE